MQDQDHSSHFASPMDFSSSVAQENLSQSLHQTTVSAPFVVTYTQRRLGRSAMNEEKLSALKRLNTLEPLSNKDRKTCAKLLAWEALRYQERFKEQDHALLSFDMRVHRQAILKDIEILMNESEVRVSPRFKFAAAKAEKDNYLFIKTELAALRIWSTAAHF